MASFMVMAPCSFSTLAGTTSTVAGISRSGVSVLLPVRAISSGEPGRTLTVITLISGNALSFSLSDRVSWAIPLDGATSIPNDNKVIGPTCPYHLNLYNSFTCMSRCCFAVDWLATSGGLLAGYNALAPLEAGQEDKFY